MAKVLNVRTRYWGKHESDGGMHTITLRAYSKDQAESEAYSRFYVRGSVGRYFARIADVRHAKRNEWIVCVGFGWDC